MAGTKGNRRVLYTKKVIQESLIELLETKKIHQITVTDICKKADINRGTFYTHYKDAFDLLNSMENELFDQIIRYIDETEVEDYRDILLFKALELVHQNRQLCKILLFNNTEGHIMEKVITIARKAQIEKLMVDKQVDPMFLDYFIRYTVGGIFAIIQNWLENFPDESPQNIGDLINKINSFKI